MVCAGDIHTLHISIAATTETSLPPQISHIHGDQGQLGKYLAELREFAPAVVRYMAPASAQDA
jgi:hypothetical protein